MAHQEKLPIRVGKLNHLCVSGVRPLVYAGYTWRLHSSLGLTKKKNTNLFWVVHRLNVNSLNVYVCVCGGLSVHSSESQGLVNTAFASFNLQFGDCLRVYGRLSSFTAGER